MTCGIPDGVRLVFLNRGVEIQPVESNVERKSATYAEGTFKLTKEAGRLVAEKVEPGEPVFFVIDGTVSHRFVYLEEGLEFRHSSTRNDEAILELDDARKVLKRGVISKSFSNIRLSKIIDYIFNERDDPLGAIHRIEFAETGDLNFSQEAQPYWEHGGVDKMYSTASDVPIRGPFAMAIEFDNVSPLEALEKTAERFQFDYWVTTDGTLKLGLNQLWGTVHEIVETDTSPAIERIDIIEASDPVSKIIIKGPTGDGFPWYPTGPLRSHATATAPGIDGDTASLEVDATPELSKLEDLAGRALLQKIMKDAGGSIVFNGMASDNTEDLSQMTVGDHIIVGEDTFQNCDVNPPQGHYTVEKVHHRINPRQGWRIRADISRVPTGIESTSWYYDPLDDKRYETLEAYESHVRETEYDTDYVT